MNTPPWDTNYVSSNVIDIQMPFVPARGIFDEAPTINVNEEESGNNDHTVPLAIKYRPKTFRELVGQESVSKTLSLALGSHKIANGYLFSGLRGSGKTSSARIFAKCLQCEIGITPNPCEKCDNCIAALDGSHMDIIELDGASNRRIDDIRDIIELTRYKPTIGRFKIFIIDEVHMLTKEAFNSLLKTLEEPPAYVKFLLATTDPLKIPPTILSRTQHFRFKKIPTNAIKTHLQEILKKEMASSDNESLDMIIRSGGGSLRDTLTLLDQVIVFCQSDITSYKLASMLGFVEQRVFDDLFISLLHNDTKACIGFIDKVSDYDTEMVLDELSIFIKNKILEDNPYIPPVLGIRYANIISDSKSMLKLDCNEEFCLLLTIMKMLEAQKIRDIKDLIKESEQANKGNKHIESMQTAKPTVPIAQQTPNNNMPSHEAPSKQSINPSHANEHIDSNKELFNIFVNEMYARDYAIGDILKQKVEFQALTSDNLHLVFYTTQEETIKLRAAYKGMMSVIAKVFGNNIRLQVDKKDSKNTPMSAPIGESSKQYTQAMHTMQNTHANMQENVKPIAQANTKAPENTKKSNYLQNKSNTAHNDTSNANVNNPNQAQPNKSNDNDKLKEAMDNLANSVRTNSNMQQEAHTQEYANMQDNAHAIPDDATQENIAHKDTKQEDSAHSNDNFLQTLSENKEVLDDMKNKLGIKVIKEVHIDDLK